MLCAVLIGATVCIWCIAAGMRPTPRVRVAFLDVGQGDAVFVEAPGGQQLLIDGGRTRRVLRSLSEVMPFYDRSIDAVLATHADADHVGGLDEVLARYAVDDVIVPRVGSESRAYRNFRRASRKENADIHRTRTGMRIALGGGAVLDILFPPSALTGGDTNMASAVALLRYGDTSFLLTGDAPDEIEQYVVRRYRDHLDSAVLKVGHHGSDTSTTDRLLGYTDPQYAVISAGADNRYGHPHEEVLRQLERFNIETLGTYESRTVEFVSDGKNITLE